MNIIQCITEQAEWDRLRDQEEAERKSFELVAGNWNAALKGARGAA